MTEYIPTHGTGNTRIDRYMPFSEPFCCLECFSINICCLDYWNPKHWNWYGFSSEMKDAPSNIIHISNLKSLHSRASPKYQLPSSSALSARWTLNLHSVSPNDSGNVNSSSLIQPASKGSCTNGFSHSDWLVCVTFEEERRVWYEISPFAYFLLIHWQDIIPPSRYSCHSCAVYAFFEVYVHLGSGTMYDFDILSFMMRPLCTSLTSPAILEHLELHIFVTSWQH